MGELEQVAQISYSSTLDDLSQYAYFNRVVGTDPEQAKAIVDLCRYYNWT